MNDIILEALKELEWYRNRVSQNKNQYHDSPDWTIRACEATIAKLAGLESRSSWTTALRKKYSRDELPNNIT